MENIIEVPTATIPVPDEEVQTELSDVESSRLAEEISCLWSDHTRLRGDQRATAKELRLLRQALAEKLYHMKSLLSRPGRSGEWRGWLKQQEKPIPRSTADRLVQRHAESLQGVNANVPSEAIRCSEVERLLQSLLPRLRRVLVGQQEIYDFVLTVTTALNAEGRDIWADGLFVFNPASEKVDAPAASTSAIAPAA